jgi:hypothetical protein
MQERAHLEGLNRQLPLIDRRPTRTKGGGALEPGDGRREHAHATRRGSLISALGACASYSWR